MTTKPTTIQERWDQFVLEVVAPDAEVINLLILKRGFIAGMGHGIDLLDDRIFGQEQCEGYKRVFRELAEELLRESDDTTRRLVRELKKNKDTEEKGS